MSIEVPIFNLLFSFHMETLLEFKVSDTKQGETVLTAPATDKKKTRKNLVMHEIVETGLSILRKKGSEEAARFMAAAGVPKNVALRVIMDSNARRKRASKE